MNTNADPPPMRHWSVLRPGGASPLTLRGTSLVDAVGANLHTIAKALEWVPAAYRLARVRLDPTPTGKGAYLHVEFEGLPEAFPAGPAQERMTDRRWACQATIVGLQPGDLDGPCEVPLAEKAST